MQGVVMMAVGGSRPGLWGELLAIPRDATVWLLGFWASKCCVYVCVCGWEWRGTVQYVSSHQHSWGKI